MILTCVCVCVCVFALLFSLCSLGCVDEQWSAVHQCFWYAHFAHLNGIDRVMSNFSICASIIDIFHFDNHYLFSIARSEITPHSEDLHFYYLSLVFEVEEKYLYMPFALQFEQIHMSNCERRGRASEIEVEKRTRNCVDSYKI